MQNFTKLDVWQRAHALAVNVHTGTEGFARVDAGYISQLRRATESIAANIAEGSAHESRKEFVRFLRIAVASTHEADNHLRLGEATKRLHVTRARAWADELSIVRRQLIRLIQRITEAQRTTL